VRWSIGDSSRQGGVAGEGVEGSGGRSTGCGCVGLRDRRSAYPQPHASHASHLGAPTGLGICQHDWRRWAQIIGDRIAPPQGPRRPFASMGATLSSAGRMCCSRYMLSSCPWE